LKEGPSSQSQAPATFSQELLQRRTLLLLGLVALGVSVWGGIELAASKSSLGNSASKAQPQRIVSLSPGVTDTIAALGGAEQLVGISDYCQPPLSHELPRAGSALTPNYEVIARLNPDVILTSEVKGAQLGPLEKLAKTHQLPWLSLTEWTHSVVSLGQILGRKKQAEDLRRKITSILEVTSSPTAPRILLALDYGDTGSDETWFIRDDSIHGAVLRAAGARNAVEGKVVGHPKLSPERLLTIDPDAIIVLTTRPERTRKAAVAHFGKWAPLRAVKGQHIGVLSLPAALNVGPSVLELVPLLRSEILSAISGAR
jgi:iron complex transport system substrate-binding protein